MITCSPLTLQWCFVNSQQYLLSFFLQTLPNTCSFCRIWSFLSSSHLKVLLSTNTPCLVSFKVIQILSFTVSVDMLQVEFSFQNSVKVTYIFLISSVYYKCLYKLWFHSFKELTCGTPIMNIKNSICACSIVSRIFISALNEQLCSALIINLAKNSICACYGKQMKRSVITFIIDFFQFYYKSEQKQVKVK